MIALMPYVKIKPINKQSKRISQGRKNEKKIKEMQQQMRDKVESPIN